MDKVESVVLVEPLCHGLEHVPFNLGFLLLVKHAFPEAKLHFIGDASHLDCIRQCAPVNALDGITLESVRLPKRHCRPFFQRLRNEKPLFSEISSLMRKDSGLVIFLASPTSTLVNAWRALSSDPRLQIHFVMHGGMSKLRTWRSRNPFLRVLEDRFLFPRLSRSNFRYVILERSIQEELKTISPYLANKSMVVEHPLPPTPPPSTRAGLSNPIKIGFLGLASPQKGFVEFCKFAKQMQSLQPGVYEFHTIGSLPKSTDFSPDLISGLTTIPAIEKIDRNEFVERILGLDFVAMPYKAEHYSASPSGILLDAIAYGKPILVTPYPTVENLFHQFGHFGILAPLTDWAQALQRFISNTPLETYGQWREVLQKVRDSRSNETLARSFRSQVLETN
jgi:glycosyltransferase involved in cell wall biosynthesis